MGQMLQTQETQRLGPLPAHGADENPVTDGHMPPRTRYRPAIVNRHPAKIRPLFGAAGRSRSTPGLRGWLVQALVLEAIIRDHIGDLAAAHRALLRALELAEQDQLVLPFTIDPVPALLERHSWCRSTHPELLAEISRVLASHRDAPSTSSSEALPEPLTESEARVLRYLPTNLSRREIGRELYLSVHTVRSHTKNIYRKLDAHNRSEAVRRAREYGLLGYLSPRRSLAS